MSKISTVNPGRNSNTNVASAWSRGPPPSSTPSTVSHQPPSATPAAAVPRPTNGQSHSRRSSAAFPNANRLPPTALKDPIGVSKSATAPISAMASNLTFGTIYDSNVILSNSPAAPSTIADFAQMKGFDSIATDTTQPNGVSPAVAKVYPPASTESPAPTGRNKRKLKTKKKSGINSLFQERQASPTPAQPTAPAPRVLPGMMNVPDEFRHMVSPFASIQQTLPPIPQLNLTMPTQAPTAMPMIRRPIIIRNATGEEIDLSKLRRERYEEGTIATPPKEEALRRPTSVHLEIEDRFNKRIEEEKLRDKDRVQKDEELAKLKAKRDAEAKERAKRDHEEKERRKREQEAAEKLKLDNEWRAKRDAEETEQRENVKVQRDEDEERLRKIQADVLPEAPSQELHASLGLEQLMKQNLPTDLSGEITTDRQEMAHGGFAFVIKGTWEIASMQVAIKVIKARKNRGRPQAWESSLERRLNRELHVWAALNHPNIAEFLGFSEGFGDFPAMISKWCHLGTAADYLSRGVISLETRYHLLQDVADGLGYLHGLKIIHGDLKPTNILIDDEHNARLCDFGLVRLDGWEGPAGMTTTSPYTGTERYKAPELFASVKNRHPVATTQGDIYALACIMLEFMLPYQQFTRSFDLMEAIKDGVPPAIRPKHAKNSSNFDEYFWDLLEACWSHIPENRPQAGEVIDILIDLPNLASSIATNTQAHKWVDSFANTFSHFHSRVLANPGTDSYMDRRIRLASSTPDVKMLLTNSSYVYSKDDGVDAADALAARMNRVGLRSVNQGEYLPPPSVAMGRTGLIHAPRQDEELLKRSSDSFLESKIRDIARQKQQTNRAQSLDLSLVLARIVEDSGDATQAEQEEKLDVEGESPLPIAGGNSYNPGSSLSWPVSNGQSMAGSSMSAPALPFIGEQRPHARRKISGLAEDAITQLKADT